MNQTAAPEIRDRRGWRSLAAGAAPLLAAASLALHLGVIVCFSGRWDSVAAITIIPIWGWALPGLALATAAWGASRHRLATAAGTLWLVTLLIGPDESRGLWRAAFSRTAPPVRDRPADEPPGRFRVVSLNCRGSHFPSARAAAAWNPDVLLLQEMRSGPAGPLRALARDLWGDEASMVFGYDTVILARGQLTATTRSKPGQIQQFVQATLTRPDGRQLEVASVHLQGHVTDLRLWKKRVRRAHAENHRRHRLYVADVILGSFSAAAGNRPCLMGGDFNAPAGDRTFRALRPRFRDAFAEAGLGWGNTFRSDWPIVRIDHLWATPELRPRAARTDASPPSDHRLLVVDYDWP